ncbi:M23 family metallopeptidase [Enterobacter bugandensis]|uniref:M23 family metallopeptidase n=1 Tax=Enterobacter bugandensis TaxID=881260 RepID=UPI000795D6BB|nr:M23 family metallopeptidase [Enterobacter bugandensis]SAI42793.1 pyocin R%2C lytic enzyme [Enterobacter bugandensis]
MIISPPFLRNRTASQSDADWTGAMMPVNTDQGFPLNGAHSWHGGVHITHTDSGTPPEKIRAIADGVVVSFRQPSSSKDAEPLNYLGPTDDGFVLLKHETETGSGDNGKVVFYSLCMHMKFLEAEIKQDAKIYRKAPLGSSGSCSGRNEFHFQIFCDDNNISKLTGRTTRELDVSKDGRTDAVYGDIHFYLPAGTTFYDKAPADNSTSLTGLSELYTSSAPLYVSMTLAQGSCKMVTRQKNTQTDGKYDLLGEPLVNADGEDYEYNLYKTAMRNYKESPSAGFELLRFGRVINTEHETLVPAVAPLWMTVSYPGGKGVVNLADPNIKKFSDADFPHWTGWQLVDDDADSNSQCNSAIIRKLQEDGEYDNQCGKLICHFPFEWEKSTIDTRFLWLKTGDDKRAPMTEADYAKFKAHAEALCFDSGVFSSGSLWYFNPVSFIKHMRLCSWLSLSDIIKLVRKYQSSPVSVYDRRHPLSIDELTKRLTEEGTNSAGEFKRPAAINEALSKILNKYGINTPIRISHFFGQMAAETGRFDSLVELGSANYFALHYDPGTDQGQKLGNTQIGDGARFKGRGSIHLTGRANYGHYSEYRQGSGSNYFTIEPHNQLIVEDAFFAFDAGGYYWSSKQKYIMRNERRVASGKLGINFWADKGASHNDAEEVTRRINPGRMAFEDVRWPAFKHAWYALNDSTEQESDYFAIKE